MRSPSSPSGEITETKARGEKVAFLGFAPYYHNFATDGALGASAILRVTFDPASAFRAGRIASVRLIEAGRPVPDPSDEGVCLVRRLSREDLGGSAVRVGWKGRILGTVGGGS